MEATTKKPYTSTEVVRETKNNVVSKPNATDAALAQKIKVRRLFNPSQIFFFSLSFMSSWEAIAGNVGAVFWNGGPQTLAWGTLIVVAGALAQSASLAEMSSIIPIAGAQYHWTNALAPTRHRRLITWFQGWITWFGWISLLCGVANVTSVLILNLAAVNNPTYVLERWHVTLVIYCMCILQGLMNMYTFWMIPWIELFAGFLHVILFVVFVIVLFVTATKHSANFVFFETATSSGWTNNYVSWNLGILTPTWGFVGFDSAVHMSEEVRASREAIPRAMFWSIAINGVLAYIMSLTILFTMGNLDAALSSSFPIIEVCTQATGSTKAATAMVVGMAIISLAVNLGSISSVSRLTWAWSRDGALPAWFSELSPKHRVPVRALWLPIFVTMIFALLNIASTSAFGAILALSELGLYTSYFIAIVCMLHARVTQTSTSPHDTRTPSISSDTTATSNYDYKRLALNPPWSLGRFGVPVNIFALVFTLYISIWLPFPSTIPVTGPNMNYAGPIFLAVVLLAAASWFLWAKRNWLGVRDDIVRFVVKDSTRETKGL